VGTRHRGNSRCSLCRYISPSMRHSKFHDNCCRDLVWHSFSMGVELLTFWRKWLIFFFQSFLSVICLCQCLLLLLYFTLLWHTFLLRFGLLGEAFRTFRSVYFVGLIRGVLMLLSRVPRLLAAVGGDKITDYWDNSFVTTVYGVHIFVSIAYYVVHLRATNLLGKSRFYSAQLWHYSLKRL